MATLASLNEEERSRLAALTTLNVLRRQDGSVRRILCSSSHVIVYELEQTPKGGAKWKHTDIQGALHVIQRDTEPQFRLLVMNRKGIDNLMDDLIPGKVELEFSTRLIMYKNLQGSVRGIWFYDEGELGKAQRVVEDIVAGKIPPETSSQAYDANHAALPEKQQEQYQDENNNNTANESNGIERFFPGLESSLSQQNFEPRQVSDNVQIYPPYSVDNAVYRDHSGAYPVQNGFDSRTQLPVEASAIAVPMPEDGNLLLSLLQGTPQEPPSSVATFHDSAIVAQSSPAEHLQTQQNRLLTDMQAGRELPASQTNLNTHLPLHGEEDELLSLLGRAAELSLTSETQEERLSQSLGRRLTKEELRRLALRLVEDDSYFDQVYEAYASR